MKKVLVVIVNYGNSQVHFLDKVVESFKSFKNYDLDIVIHSNIPLEYEGVEVIVKDHMNDWNTFPWETRKTIYDRKDDYDLYLYTENDHLYKESHLDSFLEVTDILPENRIAGFMQYEEFPEDKMGYLYPAYHASYEWDIKSVEKYDNTIFAHFNCEHHAGYLLTKKHLDKVISKMGKDFLVDKNRGIRQPGKPGYDSNKVRCCTDVYTHAGMKKVIPISRFDDFLIHHLPNKYKGIFGNYSFDKNRMRPNLEVLLKKSDFIDNIK